jgi:hypothetical protein
VSGGGLTRPAGGGLADTLLRPRTFAAATNAGGPNPGFPAGDNLPLFTLGANGGNPRADARTAAHPYLTDEPLRKVMNSFTTTSDTFVVLAVVGWFEVREEIPATGTSPAQRVYGAEVFVDSPGDLQQRFMAVVDRTGLAVDHPVNSPLTQTPRQPWTFELATALPAGNTGLRAELVGPGAPRGTWNGAGPEPVTAELQFHDGTAGAVSQPDPAGPTGFFNIMPRFTRDGGGNIVAGPETMEVSATYDGQTVRLVASGQGGTPISTTPFWVGTGETLELVEAFYDGTTRWSYNPTTGAVRVSVRPVTTGNNVYPALANRPNPTNGFAFSHEGGGQVSNVVFRHPGPQTKTYKPGQTDPVVRMVSELR